MEGPLEYQTVPPAVLQDLADLGIDGTDKYCVNLYNEKLLPYAFKAHPLAGRSDGFPVWIDINLSQSRAMEYFSYLLDGLYLDPQTKELNVQTITYNAELEYFANVLIKFIFAEGVTIKVKYDNKKWIVRLYVSTQDYVRLVMEILLASLIATSLLLELYEIYKCYHAKGTIAPHFKSVWNFIDLVSIAMQLTTVALWWTFYFQGAKKFQANIRYDVYASLDSPANFLDLNVGPEGCASADGSQCIKGYYLDQANNMFEDVQLMANILLLYMTLNGINIILILLRILKLMDFQPRMGVVTRSLALAASDLFHFFFLAFIIYFGYAMMAHL